MAKYIPLIWILILSGCVEKIGEPTTPIDKGKEYLIYGQYQEAINEFNKVLQKNPNNCDANYGILLANTGLGIKNLNILIGTFLNTLQGLGSQPSSLISLAENPVDELVENYLIPFLQTFDVVENSVRRIEKLGCIFTLDHYVIDIKLGNLLWIYMDLRGEWSITEAKIIGAIFDFFTALDYLILSLDLSINTSSALRALLNIAAYCAGKEGAWENPLNCISNIDENLILNPLVQKLIKAFNEGDIISILRLLGFILEESPNFLNWHPDRFSYFLDVGKEFASALTRISDSLLILLNRTEGKPLPSQVDDPFDDVIVFYDGENRGRADSSDKLYLNAYNPLKPQTPMDENNWCLNVFISGLDNPSSGEWCKNTIFELLIPPLITNESILSRFLRILYKWANILSAEDMQSFINAEDINVLSIINIGLPDVFAFKPQNWFTKTPEEFLKTVSPPRKWLPYYKDEDGDGYAEFLIEGEYFNPQNYPCGNTHIKYGDCDHFPSEVTFSYTNPPTLNLKIPPDCLEPTEGIFNIYLASRDPTFGGALYVKLNEENRCQNSVENKYPQVFTSYILPMEGPDGLYFFNKSINILFRGFLSPLLELIGGGLPF